MQIQAMDIFPKFSRIVNNLNCQTGYLSSNHKLVKSLQTSEMLGSVKYISCLLFDCIKYEQRNSFSLSMLYTVEPV